jgi:hypothetical protein
MTSRLQQRRDTAANWTSNNPTLAAGEIGLESDTSKFKIGNGSTAWTSLSYANGITASSTDTLTNKTLTAPQINLTLNAQTGTTYTFALADNGQLVTASNASAQTYSIPTNASVAFPVGAQINIIQIGAGQVTIQAVTSGTTTVASTGATATTPKLRVQYSSATCIKVATDVWYVIGDIA